MGWFGSSGPKPEPAKKLEDGGFEAPNRSGRKACWDSRDNFYRCLDRNNILDAVAEDKLARQQCGKELAGFEGACAKTWVEYFKKMRVAEHQKAEQLAKLEAEGAVPIQTR